MATYIPIDGRPAWKDRVRQTLKRCLPAHLRARASRIESALLNRRRRIAFEKLIKQRLGCEIADVFIPLHQEAMAAIYHSGAIPPPTIYDFAVPGHDAFRVNLRQGTSDFLLFAELLVEQAYELPADVEPPQTVLDVGANVGLASSFFLTKYPRCSVLAIEPDPINHELARQNLAQFGARATLVQAAVWHEETALRVTSGDSRGTWSSTVETGSILADDQVVEALTVDNILDRYGLTSVDLLKMDIEGAEAEVFRHGSSWRSRVKTFIVEPETELSRRVMLELLDDGSMRFLQRRDVIIAYPRLPCAAR